MSLAANGNALLDIIFMHYTMIHTNALRSFRLGHIDRFGSIDSVVTNIAAPVVTPQRAWDNSKVERDTRATGVIRARVVPARDPIETKTFPCLHIHGPEVSPSGC